MAIEFRCTQCNQLLRVPEDAGGKSARCPKCQALMMVPATAPSPVAPPASPSSPAAPAPAPTSDSPFNILQQLPPPAPPPKPPADANPFGDAAGGGSPFGAAAPSLNPYASPGAAAIDTYYSQTQTFTGRPGLPWENQKPSFAAWWATAKLCMMQPSYAYSIMRQGGGMGQPMLYCGVGLALGTVGQMIWYVPLMVIVTLAGSRGQPAGGEIAMIAGAQIIGQVIGGAFGIVIGATIGLIIGAAISHVCLMLVGGARQSYETTLRVVGYAHGSTAWMNVIPGGGLVAFVWMFVLEILGFAKAHEITTGKSALAVFLPVIVCGTCGVVIAVIAIIAGVSGAFR